MGWGMGVFTFLNVWCLTLFFVIICSAKPDPERSSIEYAAAPQMIAWKKKLWLNTLISVVVTLVIAFIINSGMFPMNNGRG